MGRSIKRTTEREREIESERVMRESKIESQRG